MKYFKTIIIGIYILTLLLTGCNSKKEVLNYGRFELQPTTTDTHISTDTYQFETDGETFFDLPELDMSGKEKYLEMLDTTMRALNMRYGELNELTGITLSDYKFLIKIYRDEGYLFCQVADGGVANFHINSNDYTGWIEYDGVICLIDNKSNIPFEIKEPLNIKRIIMTHNFLG